MVTMRHDYSKHQMKVLGSVFMTLPIFFVGLRLWAKWLSAKRLGLDDYLAISALLVSITCCGLQISTADYGHLGSHQPVDENGNAIMEDPGLIFFERTKFALNCISIVGLGLVKASILVLYRNIFKASKFKIAINISLIYVICWTVSFTISHIFTCVPITVFIEPYYGNKCVQTVPMFLALLYTDVIADFVILVLPVPMVAQIQLPAKQKLGVIGMFSLGAAVCAISVTRVVATYAIAEEYINHPNDVIYYTAPVFFWTNIELSLAVVCACLPTIRPIWFHFFPRKQVSTAYSGYGYGSSGLPGTKNSSLGPRLARRPYEEIDELELTQHPGSSERSESLEEGEGGGGDRGRITKQVTIQQTNTEAPSEDGLSLRGWKETSRA